MNALGVLCVPSSGACRSVFVDTVIVMVKAVTTDCACVRGLWVFPKVTGVVRNSAHRMLAGRWLQDGLRNCERIETKQK